MTILALSDPAWTEFVRSCPAALPFHHPAWAGMLAECYGYRPLVVALPDKANQIDAGLPIIEVRSPLAARRWISLPFTDYCPVLTLGCSEKDLADTLMREMRAHGAGRFELHGPLMQRRGLYSRDVAVRHTLALDPDPQVVYRRFTKMHQRNIRIAERAGVRVELGRSASDLRRFYDLHLITRRRLGVPIQPRRFFDLLAQRVIADGLGFVLSAYLDQVPVASAVFLAWNGMLIYKYGASDQAFRQHRPNNLLFWAAIRWGCENGYHTLDFGRTDTDNTGLREFKDGWSAHEEPLIYSTIADHPPQSASGRAEKMMGEVIRRSPPWVCRVLGELFYRYAA
jgi:CelD/BcsL family acetyltransferase involved in cellulose biosynthesis